MRKVLCLVLALLVFASVNAYVEYVDCNLELEDEYAIANIMLYIHSKMPANHFSVTMPFHKESAILSINDSLGTIEDYALSDGILRIKTNSSARRRDEIINIEAKLFGLEKERFGNAIIAEFSLATEEKTRVAFRAYGKRIFGFDTGAAFRGSIRDYELRIAGAGPLIVRFGYSDKGKEYGRFLLFNESTLSDDALARGLERANELYFTVPAVLGIELDSNIFGIAVLKDEKYREKINDYSEGVYITGGLIVVKESAFEKDAAPVVLHELTHNFNAKIMNWNSSNTSWFDEALAKFVEYIVRKQLGLRTANLFYGTQSYSDAQYSYVIKPASDWRLLKEYYDKNESFMMEWSADAEGTRKFGYAFVELFLREYVKEHGFGALHRALRELAEIKENVSDARRFSEIVLERLGTRLEPCKRETSEEMLECIEALNKFNPKIPKASVLKLGTERKESVIEFNINDIRRKNIEERFNDFGESLLNFLEKLIRSTEVLVK
ncbi:MAG: hypothetical protein J7L44_04060 [Candidatus Diapherotrites archaeon]|nr:hypothetical protein [Candidatus Diapherotrites archaeon]